MNINKNENGLEAVIREYEGQNQIDFSTLRRWESEISDPFDLIQLYDKIVMNHVLVEEGASKKTLELGLLGYIKGQKMNVTEKAKDLATTDSLTGLSNKRGYQGMIETTLSRAVREDYASLEKSVALVFIDVNNLKVEANDKYGHKFGDDILRYVGEALKLHTRATDGKARVGGDEFVVVVDPLDAMDVAKFLRDLTRKINQYIQIQVRKEHYGKKSAVTVSLGMSIYGKDANNKEELYSHSDDAMYYAKSNPISHKKRFINYHIFNPQIIYMHREKTG